MNDLSWLIYLAGAAANLGFVLNLGFFLTFVGCVTGVIYGMTLKEHGFRDPRWARGHDVQKFWLRALTIPLVLILLRIPLPSRETIYAIAASEMGEQVLDSPTAGKAMRALDAWLDRQIEQNTDKRRR